VRLCQPSLTSARLCDIDPTTNSVATSPSVATKAILTTHVAADP